MKWKPEDWARLGEVIRKSREQQGYSRKRLAEMSGVSEKSIQLAEEGRVPTRWPKSIDALVAALEWVPGTDKRVLDGYDPESELTDNTSTPAGGAAYGPDLVVQTPGGTQVYEAKQTHQASATVRPTVAWWVSQFEHLDLPEEIRRVLPQVMFLGSSAVAHGADQWMAGAFTNAVYMMLDQVSRARRAEVKKRTPANLEESDAQLTELEQERRSLLAGVQAMEALLGQLQDVSEDELTPGDRESLETLAELKKQLEEMGPPGTAT